MDGYRGIDYGMGQTNIDKKTGIRFGVISVNALTQYIWDHVESDYGDPTCPKCGNKVEEYDEDTHGEFKSYQMFENHPEWNRDCIADYACKHCKHYIDSDHVWADEPNGHYYEDKDTKFWIDSHNDVMILKSPYYTRAQFCSPCAPGACYLTNAIDNGEKAYCLDTEWFDQDEEGEYSRPCPYPIWRVDNDELIYKPKKEDEQAD